MLNLKYANLPFWKNASKKVNAQKCLNTGFLSAVELNTWCFIAITFLETFYNRGKSAIFNQHKTYIFLYSIWPISRETTFTDIKQTGSFLGTS